MAFENPDEISHQSCLEKNIKVLVLGPRSDMLVDVHDRQDFL